MTASSADETLAVAPAARAVAPAAIGLRTKLSYGAGAVIDGVTSASLTYFLLFYLTGVCGLSGTLAGLSTMLALVLDAFADPLIGLVSDNTRSRWGRRVPYLLIAPIPMAILFVLLFSIPASMTGLVLFGYATLCAMGLRMAMSLFALPYFAAGAELSDDYAERTSIVSWRIAFQMLGTFAAIALGLGVFMSGPSGVLDRPSYIPFAWTCAGLIVAAGLVSGLAVKRELARLHVAKPIEGGLVRQFLREFGDVFRNRSFLVLFSATLVFFVAQGAAGALTLYSNLYFWKLPNSTVQMVIIATTLGPFVGAPLTAWLTRFLEKRTLTVANFVVFSLLLVWTPLAQIAGLLPSGAPLVAILSVTGFLSGTALVGAAIGFQSMLADAADEHEHLFGVRREGLFFSGLTVAVKAASGLGTLVAGVGLDLIGFPTEIAAKGETLRIAADVTRSLGLIAGPAPAVITLIAPLLLCAYTLSRSKHAAILTDLADRRGRAVPPVA